MVLIFDPKLYPAHERREAYEALLSSLSCPVSVTFDHAVTDDVIEGWQLGPSGQLLQGRYYSGQLARRTARHVRRGTQEKISFSVNFSGDCVTVSRDYCFARNGEVRILDLTSPYERRHHVSVSASFEIECVSLSMSVDVVRAAIPHIAASPLHALAARHLAMLPRVLDQPRSAQALPMLAETTTQLMRALVASVTAHDAVRRQGLADTQLARVDAYIAQHLRDPALSPAEIAASQFMSLRQLYKLFAQRSSTPAEWIISKRLAGSREELARQPGTPVSLIAARWGFQSATHFTRRFRAAYGILPSAWAQQAEAGRPPDTETACVIRAPVRV